MSKFLFAAGFGCLLGLLFAPRKGAELRSDICSRLNELQSKLGEHGEELKEDAKERMARASEHVSKAREKAAESFGKLDKNLHEIVGKA